MKLCILFLSLCLSLGSPTLSEVRKAYVKANDNKELTLVLFNSLSSVNEADDPALLAYKGAVMSMMAKYTTDRKEKKDYFKNGVSLLETAFQKSPENIEIRYIRLSVQENAPKFLKYNAAIDVDRTYISKNFKNIKNSALKNVVKAYILQSSAFLPNTVEGL